MGLRSAAMTQTRKHLAVLVLTLLVAGAALFAVRAHGQSEHDQKIDRIADDYTTP